MVVRLTGNRTDGKIFDKSYKKHLIPFNALFKSWYKGQQKNPHLSESDESVNEGGMGILTSDQADILQGIVLRNKNKNLKGILNVALKSGHFKGVDKKELLGYIDGAKQFVKYMKSHPMESVDEAVEPQGNMAKIAKIVKRKQASKLGGVMIDMQSASLLMKLYDKVSDKDKEKMNKLNAKMLTTVIKRLWSRVNLKLPV
jgi:flagellar hook-basal body complex protein FliE